MNKLSHGWNIPSPKINTDVSGVNSWRNGGKHSIRIHSPAIPMIFASLTENDLYVPPPLGQRIHAFQ